MFFIKEQRNRSIFNNSLSSIYDDGYFSINNALKNSDVYSAINIISSDLASANINFKNENIQKSFDTPSSFISNFSFWQGVYQQLLLDGNAYILNINSFFEFILPSHVTLEQDDTGKELFYRITFDDYRGTQLFPASQMIHFKLIGDIPGIHGQSPLMALRNELIIKNSSDKLASSSLKKAVKPSSIIKVNAGNLNAKQKEGVRNAFERSNGGDNAGRVLVMDELTDFKPLEMNSDVSNLLNATNWTSGQIAKVFGLPSDMLGQESQHSNSEQIMLSYYQTLRRYMKAIVSELQFKLKDEKVTFDLSEIIDVNGSQLENRLINLTDKEVISKTQAQELLTKSHSDIIDDKNINVFNKEGPIE